MASNNKLTTLGYFIKRLRDSGYLVNKLYNNYSATDPRAWSVVIDPSGASVICTCYKNHEEMGDNYFEIYDGGQFIPAKIKVRTDSIEVFVTYLVNFGINNKAADYADQRVSNFID